MTLDELKTKVGQGKWSLACSAAWKRAPKTGQCLGPPLQPANITGLSIEEATAFSEVSDLVDDWWAESKESDVSRIELLTELYHEMPSYRLLAFKIDPSYKNFSPEARSVYWNFAREMLSSPEDALADPVAYDLWCGLFEDRAYVQEAWNELVEHQPSRRQLERVLESSGPVPFVLKHDLYTKLIEDQSWHYYIYKSLLYSNFDVLGDNDRFAAREILKRLALPPETEHLKDLELALGM